MTLPADDDLAALILPLLPYSDIPEPTDADRIADAIRARFRVVPFPKGHVRESIDPRRDIEPHGIVLCRKCRNPVARYEVRFNNDEWVISYSSLGIPQVPCID